MSVNDYMQIFKLISEETNVQHLICVFPYRSGEDQLTFHYEDSNIWVQIGEKKFTSEKLLLTLAPEALKHNEL